MANKTVSAILFCYNEERYIEKAIRSLLNQTYPISQIIVVDDYSTDNTVEIIRQFIRLDSRVKLLHNLGGKSKVLAYERGLKAVKTDFFFVIGSDDEADRNLIEVSIKYIRRLSTPFFFHSAILIDENSINTNKKFISIFNPESCFFYNKTGGLIFAHKCIVNRITPFPVGLEFEDWYTVLKLYEQYGEINTNPKPYVKYRIHQASSSQSLRFDWPRRKELLLRDIKFLKIAKKKLLKNNFKKSIDLSLKFRKRLIVGIPTIGINLNITFLFMKTFLTMLLARMWTLIK